LLHADRKIINIINNTKLCNRSILFIGISPYCLFAFLFKNHIHGSFAKVSHPMRRAVRRLQN
jgi:hypothetical protein